MTAEKKILWLTSVGVVAVVLALMLSGTAERKLAPRPVAAWLAVRPTATGPTGC